MVTGDVLRNLVDGILIGTVVAMCGGAAAWVVVIGAVAREVPRGMTDHSRAAPCPTAARAMPALCWAPL